MSDEFDKALREAEARRAAARDAEEATRQQARAEAKIAEDELAGVREEAARRVPPAIEAGERLQSVGRPYLRRGEGGALKVSAGSPSLPAGMGLWGRDRLWHRGRQSGWIVPSQPPGSDFALPIFVPLVGEVFVREPVGNGNLTPAIGLPEFAQRGHRRSRFDPGEGLPQRVVVDANFSLQRFIDVVADYVVAVGR